jgi:hypothetical protein
MNRGHISLKKFSSKWFAILFPALVGLAFCALSVRGLALYGWSLFVGLPLLVSALSAFLWCLQPSRSFRSTYGIALLSLVVLGVMLLFIAIDGLICLLMVFPLVALLCLLGVALGRFLSRFTPGASPTKTLPCVLVVLFPGVTWFEASTQGPPPMRVVTTSVAIRAPAERVWQSVVAFPAIDVPPTGILRFGIAYPLSARIEGSGVGAIRYCTFSTGSFVEPITTWQPPTQLGFDVTSCPEPMKEFSPYRDLHAPHLNNYMVSHRGEFRVRPNGDGCIIEGTTWYSHSISPDWYWGPLSDYIIHRIHERVLHHIKRNAEGT